MHLQNQSQLVWGIKDKLRKFCSTNDMKELLIANSQEVPSGESNVRDAVSLLLPSESTGMKTDLLLLCHTFKLSFLE